MILESRSVGAIWFASLKWTPAIALGYAVSIGVHMVINRSLF